MELVSLTNVLDNIKTLINAANIKISKHNMMVSNLAHVKAELTSQVWRYLLDHEINSDLARYKNEKSNLERAKTNLKEKISNANQEKTK